MEIDLTPYNLEQNSNHQSLNLVESQVESTREINQSHSDLSEIFNENDIEQFKHDFELFEELEEDLELEESSENIQQKTELLSYYNDSLRESNQVFSLKNSKKTNFSSQEWKNNIKSNIESKIEDSIKHNIQKDLRENLKKDSEEDSKLLSLTKTIRLVYTSIQSGFWLKGNLVKISNQKAKICTCRNISIDLRKKIKIRLWNEKSTQLSEEIYGKLLSISEKDNKSFIIEFTKQYPQIENLVQELQINQQY